MIEDIITTLMWEQDNLESLLFGDLSEKEKEQIQKAKDNLENAINALREAQRLSNDTFGENGE